MLPVVSKLISVVIPVIYKDAVDALCERGRAVSWRLAAVRADDLPHWYGPRG